MPGVIRKYFESRRDGRSFQNETIGNMKTVCCPFSRPGGTRADADGYPALKHRAIVGLSLWDGDGFCLGRWVIGLDAGFTLDSCRTP